MLHYSRISLTLACPMDLKLYPLDRQQCEMRIASCKSPPPTLSQDSLTVCFRWLDHG